MTENLNFPELIESIFLKNDNKNRCITSEETIELLFDEYWNGDNIWFKEKWKEFRELDGNNMMFDLKSGFRKFKSMLKDELEKSYNEELQIKDIIKIEADGICFVGFTSSFNKPSQSADIEDIEESMQNFDNSEEEPILENQPVQENIQAQSLDLNEEINEEQLFDKELEEVSISSADMIMNNTEPFDLLSLYTSDRQDISEDNFLNENPAEQPLLEKSVLSVEEEPIFDNEISSENDILDQIEDTISELKEAEIEQILAKIEDSEEVKIDTSEIIMNNTSPIDLSSISVKSNLHNNNFQDTTTNDEILNNLDEINSTDEEIEEETLNEALKIAIMEDIFDSVEDNEVIEDSNFNIVDLSDYSSEQSIQDIELEEDPISKDSNFIEEEQFSFEEIASNDTEVLTSPILDEEPNSEIIEFVLEEGEVLESKIDLDSEEDIQANQEELLTSGNNTNQTLTSDTPLVIKTLPLTNFDNNVFLDGNYGILKPTLSQALGNFGLTPFNTNKEEPSPVNIDKKEVDEKSYDAEKPEVLTFADNLVSEEIYDEEFELTNETNERKILLAEENGFEISQIISDNKDNNNVINSEEELFPLLSNFIYNNHNFNAYSKSMDKPENDWNCPRFVALGGDICNDRNDELFNEFVGGNHQDVFKIYSFNVKIEANLDNMREYFFQCVSNSNWANEGYLVISSIEEENNRLIRDELKRLSAFYGIGVILLDTFDLENSEIISLSEARHKLDFNFINKLISNSTNTDFRDFISNINEIKRTGQFNNDLFDNFECNNENNKSGLKYLTNNK